MMDEIEIQLLVLEESACRHARRWDAVAGRKMRSGEICSSCRRPLPQPHTPERKRCDSCAGKHHVRMTFFCHRGWHCHFFTERWQQLPKRFLFQEAASVRETARRGDGLVDDEVRRALDLSLKIGKGGVMLRLTDEQFQAIGGCSVGECI
jgi:LSD1 subclass zinc finger protein